MLTSRWFLLLILSACALATQERITIFTSNITVNADATLRVQETIEVVSTGADIIHGIVREFPTIYKHNQVNYVVDFKIQSVTHNGIPAPSSLESIKNGKKLYIGEKGHKIATGRHTYVITYTTNRQLGFFDDHDELYWNVTGSGWRLPIDKVYASVQLPLNITRSSIAAEAYTGFEGERGQNYTYALENNRVTFATTHALQPYEGFTIVVTWPKGFVHEPSWYQKACWFLRDNLFFAWTLLAFLLLIILIMYASMLIRHKNKPGTVIPLFYPPEGFTPSAVGFMKARKFENQLLAADIVNLGVHGFVGISCAPGALFKHDTYTLKLKKDPATQKPEPLNDYEVALLSVLFGTDKFPSGTNTLTLIKEHAAIIDAALQKTLKQCEKKTSEYIGKLSNILYLGCALVATWFIGALIFGLSHSDSIYLFSLFMILGIAKIKHSYHVYTPKGRKIQDQIDGFELYLTTAEVDRMNIIGTPPTRTPELYETYLPYAIALGVEKQWTEQFASVFATLAQQGHPYTPRWYVGRPFNVNSFASNIGSSFNSAIASASIPPGKSSGSGGRGRSGGGGGGGGGGGW